MNCTLESRVIKVPDIENRHSITISTPRFKKPTTTLSKSTNAEHNQKYSKNLLLEINIRTFSFFCIQKTKQSIGIDLHIIIRISVM